MTDFDPLPRHTTPFTKAQIDALLASKNNWFTKGSNLFLAATKLIEWLDNPEDRFLLIVGLPVATCLNSPEYVRIEREIVPAMVFAMAVECWLKGLLLASLPAPSREAYKRLKSFLDSATDEVTEEDVFPAIVAALQSTEGLELSNKADEEKALTDTQLRQVIDKHRSHDLQRLAIDAGLNPHLSQSDREYLEFLTTAIVNGRYPASFNERHIIPWEGVASDRARWSSLCEAIHRRYGEVVDRPD